MEGEEDRKSSGVKKREKPVEIGFDSDDDEPIGTLLKLKGPLKVKKARLGLETGDEKGNKMEATEAKTVAVDDDSFGGLDDTLASFRRKLKGPKRESGLKNSRDRSVSSAEGDPSKQSSSLKDGSVDVVSVENIDEAGHSLDNHGSCKKSNKKNQGKVIKQKLDRVKILSNDIYEFREDLDLLESREGDGVGSKDSPDELLEDSLSSFLKKAQADAASKTKNVLGSKPRRGRKIEKADSSGGSSKGDKGTSLSVTVRKMSSCSSSMKVARKNQNKENPRGRSVSAANERIQVENKSSDDNTCCSSRCIKQEHSMSKGLDSAQEVYPPEPCDTEKLCSGDVELTSTKGSEIGLAAEAMMETQLNLAEPKGGSMDAVSEEKADVSISRVGDEVQDDCLDNELLNKSCADAAENVHILSNGREPGAPVNFVENVLSKGWLKNDSFGRSATPGNDDITMDEIPDENENSLPDSSGKENILSAAQRRKAKKYRHEDMAYEGDAEWDTLLCEQNFLGSYQPIDHDRPHRSRGKVDSSANGGAAAVSVGLKARAAGPAEKIKFKEVFKRKGGLQEYLECRLITSWTPVHLPYALIS